ncbi:MAG TPA: hypothetical protein VMV93_09625 [Chloroflexota bacterium]|nr:hypothetical protein [Chloroflexota bacterium]
MAEADIPLEQLNRYARIARNSLMLLVIEPPNEISPDIDVAREAISDDALGYLNEVAEGVESPYFTTYTRGDARFIDRLAANKARQSAWDRAGIFQLEPRIRPADAKGAMTATFAYLAASCMRHVKAPFYVAPTLRTSVRGPRNLGEFLSTVEVVKDVTRQARGSRYHDLVQRNEWRTAFAFWESTQWLSQTMRFPRKPV